MIETLQPFTYQPDLSKARLVSFALPTERAEDKKPDNVIHKEINLAYYYEVKNRKPKTPMELWQEKKNAAVDRLRKARRSLAIGLEEISERRERAARKHLNAAIKHLEAIEREKPLPPVSGAESRDLLEPLHLVTKEEIPSFT